MLELKNIKSINIVDNHILIKKLFEKIQFIFCSIGIILYESIK